MQQNMQQNMQENMKNVTNYLFKVILHIFRQYALPTSVADGWRPGLTTSLTVPMRLSFRPGRSLRVPAINLKKALSQPVSTKSSSLTIPQPSQPGAPPGTGPPQGGIEQFKFEVGLTIMITSSTVTLPLSLSH
jgi:hypothetical protein